MMRTNPCARVEDGIFFVKWSPDPVSGEAAVVEKDLMEILLVLNYVDPKCAGLLAESWMREDMNALRGDRP